MKLQTMLIILRVLVQKKDFVVEKLEQSPAILFKWLNNNYMKVNMELSFIIWGNTKSIKH